MAKTRRATKARKTYVKRVSKAEKAVINNHYYGAEPTDAFITEKPLVEGRLADVLTWYNACCSRDEGKQYLLDFLEDSPYYDAIARMDNDWLSLTACWLARLMTRGADIQETSVKFFQKKLKEMVASPTAKPKLDDIGPGKKSVQDNIRQKTGDLFAEIEGMIDDGATANKDWSLYQVLTDGETASTIASRLADRYQPIADELQQAVDGTDDQLVEAYSHMTKRELRKQAEFYQTLVADARKFGTVNKKAKKARKIKLPSVEKKLALFKCMDKSDEYQIASIPPSRIFTANELWTFNTTNRMITVFRAKEGQHLNVRRTAIVDYDETLSVCKRTGKKTKDTLNQILNGNKRTLSKLMDTLSTEPDVIRSRIHDSIILLKAF